MNTATTFRVEFTTFVFNGQYMVHGKGSTKWYRSEAEIPAVYMASVGLKYDDEMIPLRWDGVVVVRND